MNIDQKLNEYKENIETLAEIDSLEVYQWLMSLGEKDICKETKLPSVNMTCMLTLKKVDSKHGVRQ